MGVKKKVPDNVVANPHSLPYASDLSAPVIKPNNLGAWKSGSVHSANKYFKERFDKIKSEAEELSNEFKWNEIIFNAEMRFKPVMGKDYYLYEKQDFTFYLTLSFILYPLSFIPACIAGLQKLNHLCHLLPALRQYFLLFTF